MYARGKFGIEYTPPPPKPESSWLGWVLVVAALAAVTLIIRTIWIRVSSQRAEAPEASLATMAAEPEATARPKIPQATNDSFAVSKLPEDNYANRSPRIRNLLLRLKEAERVRDLEMAVSTIEQLRALPGAADLDDILARKLGALNFQRLFTLKSAQWTIDVKVKRGDSASRIAYEHGSTLASLAKLNDGSVDKLKIGRMLTVMNHPRFNLVISRRARTADLLLNGKFFKRYYLTGDVTGAVGSYETPERFRGFCDEKGVPFKPLDRAEIEMLLPKGTAVFIKEI